VGQNIREREVERLPLSLGLFTLITKKKIENISTKNFLLLQLEEIIISN